MSNKKFPNDKSLAELQEKYGKTNIANFENYNPDWIDLNSIKARSQPWLFEGFIPLETTTLFAGPGGIGKSLLLINLIAKTTTGKEFNCCGKIFKSSESEVILMSAEDSVSIQLIPKLKAADADLTKIHLITSTVGVKSKKKKFLCLDEQLIFIEQKLIERKGAVKFLVIDPITYFVGNVKDHVQMEVCNFIQSLNDLAEKYEIAIIINKHLRKKSGKQTVASIVDEVGGSGAWVNTPRQSFVIVQHPMDEDKILILNLKVNIAKRIKAAFVYAIEPVSLIIDERNIETVKLVWADKMEDISLDEVASKESFIYSKAQIAKEEIKTFLKKNGLQRVKVTYEHCKSLDITQRTAERALQDLIKERVVLRDKSSKLPHVKLADGWDDEQE